MSEQLLALLQQARSDQQFRAKLMQTQSEHLAALGLKAGQQAVLLSNLLLTEPFHPEMLPDWDTRFGHAFSWVDLRSHPIPWTPFEKPLQSAKVALITTAGIHRCDDPPFNTQDEERGDPSYRVIPMETFSGALCVKHHLALVQPGPDGDTNHLLPLRAAGQLQREGIIGALASAHYSFMGYIPHTQPLREQSAPEVARRLRAEHVDAAVLVPV